MTPPPAPAATTRFQHLDSMRAVAVLLVVVAHAGLGEAVPGGSGVTIFFVISGFIITHLLVRERARTGAFAVGGFFRRRLVKLAPPVVVLILAPTAVYALWEPVNPWAVLSQVAFAYNWVYLSWGPADVLPGSQVLWSLAIEEQFYLLVAPAWLVLLRTRRPLRWLGWMAALIVVAAALIRLGIALEPGAQPTTGIGDSNRRIYYGSDTRADALALGVLAALLHARWVPGAHPRLRTVLASNWALIGALAVFIGSLAIRDPFFRDVFRYGLQAGAAAIVILHGFARAPAREGSAFSRFERSRALQAVGLASYSIYIVHFALREALAPLLGDAPLVVELVVFSAVPILVGLQAYRWIELPAQRFKRRRAPATA